MNKPIFTAILEDGSAYCGGNSYFETKWKAIDKKIKRLFYILPSGDYLTITADKYYHYVEVLKDITGNNAGNVKFQFACVLAEKEGKIIQYKIDLIDKNKVEYKIYNKEDEYIKSLNKNGWR